MFQNGGGFVSEKGSWRTPVVLDNPLHQGAIPLTIGIFINPGMLPAPSPTRHGRFNRSYEYDGLGNCYAQFLMAESFPEVAKDYKLSGDPNDRAIAGSSSGSIAAFTGAWERPDAFHRAMSFIGSFTDLRGGEIYPSPIRKTEPLPLRVFLQDGYNDLNIYAGNRYLGAQEMASAPQFAGYEVNPVTGSEGHNGKQGGAIFPDAMSWLWKDYPTPIAKPAPVPGPRNFVAGILDPSSDWEIVSEGHGFTIGPAVDRDGSVFFVDVPNSRIHKIDPSGKVSVFKEDAGKTSGLMFGPDGRLYAAQNGRQRIVAYSRDGKETVIAEGVHSNDLAVSSRGVIYFSDPPDNRVRFIDAKGDKHVVDEGIAFPNGVCFSPDESPPLVADTMSKWVWSFQAQPDGSPANGEPFYRREIPDDATAGPLRSGADGMTFGTEDFLYVSTKRGIQICDRPGHVAGIIGKPSAAEPSNVVFSGADLHTLYVTAGDKVFRRRRRRQGFFPWTPVKPPNFSL